MKFFDAIKSKLRIGSKRRVVVRRIAYARPVTPSSERPVVQRFTVPLWQEKHWTKSGNSYSGFYRTQFGSWEGKIVEAPSGAIQFLISNPPQCLSKHSHFSCFIPQGDKTYAVHFSKPAKTAGDGIAEIERILTESHNA